MNGLWVDRYVHKNRGEEVCMTVTNSQKVKSITVFVNTSSGLKSKEEAPAKLQELLAPMGLHVDVREVQKGVDVTELAACAVREGCPVVVAGGGDGTVRAVASAVAYTETALGILPLGTLNHLARDLGIPIDLEGAAKVVVNGTPVAVDAAQVNGRLFVNNSVIGLYPWYRAIRDREEELGRPKPLAILKGILTVFRANPYLRVRLIVKGQQVERKTPYILVANNRHGMDGYNLGRRQSLREGRIWVYMMKPQTRWGLLRLVLSLLFGQFRGERDFEAVAAEEATVMTRGKTLNVSLDGEIVTLKTPLEFRILAGALKVIVPKDSPHAIKYAEET